MPPSSLQPATIIPTLKYRDAPAAIGWLCRAFGFSRHLVVPGENGTIAHAELTFGNGMIMLGSARPAAVGTSAAPETDRHDLFDRWQRLPAEVGGIGTASPYGVVADPDAHYDRARAAGAEIVLPLKTEDYGGRGYSCRDPEGHLWNFGSYDPWAAGPA